MSRWDDFGEAARRSVEDALAVIRRVEYPKVELGRRGVDDAIAAILNAKAAGVVEADRVLRSIESAAYNEAVDVDRIGRGWAIGAVRDAKLRLELAAQNTVQAVNAVTSPKIEQVRREADTARDKVQAALNTAARENAEFQMAAEEYRKTRLATARVEVPDAEAESRKARMASAPPAEPVDLTKLALEAFAIGTRAAPGGGAVGSIAEGFKGLPAAFAGWLASDLTGLFVGGSRQLFNSVEADIAPHRGDYLRLLDRRGVLRQGSSALGIIGGMSALPVVNALLAPVNSFAQQEAYKNWPSLVPGASDLVRFQVREVFDPAFRQQLLEGTDLTEFRQWMRLQGYDDKWADSYWAAHWELISPQMAFEMFHRLRPGRVDPKLIFDRRALESLLKRADILPAYIPQIIEIAYTPFNRVDIRRMYHLGVLSRQEVVESYLDLGYSLVNAERMAQFVEKDYAPGEEALSKSEALTAYKEGVLPRDEVLQHLQRAGIPEKNALILLEVEDRRTKRRLAVESVKAEKIAKGRVLTKAELFKAHAKGVLSEAQVLTGLQELGYDEKESRLVLLTETLKATPKLSLIHI